MNLQKNLRMMMNLMELLKKYENLIINFINFIIKIIIKLKGI